MAETRLLQGRYRLLDLIGRGGMGEVWRARDESLGRQVAVKCLKPMGPQAQKGTLARGLQERFKREARVAAALQHHGVTVVHDFGEADGVLFLVMELLEGRNLSQLLEDNQGSPLPVADVEEIAVQLAAALAYTHEQSVVHRDLKPANIVRCQDGTVKICDFGIARLGHDIGFTAKITGTGIAMGTPHYMSPEQIGGGHLDERSDLYSLGCVLYEIATGAPPFDLGDTWSILVGHRDNAPEPPRERRGELPDYLDEVVLALLAKDPEHRPESARELARRLAAGRAGGQPLRHAARTAPASTTGELPLPAWAQSMTAGRKAGTAGDRGAVTPALTRHWVAAGREPSERVPRQAPPAGAEALRTEALRAAEEGRWTEACELHRKVMAERGRALGPDHPETLTSRYEVGYALARVGRDTQALQEYEQVAAARERVLGALHPETLGARQETAYVLGRLGRHTEAHRLYLIVLAGREQTLGPDHPDTLRCRHDFAFNLGRMGQVEEACRLAAEVAEQRARVLGPLHQDTLVSRYEVGYALGRLGRWAEALEVYGFVAEARGRALGPTHPETLAARYEVGIGLGRLGRSEEALHLYRELLADRTRIGGPEDLETLRARHGLGVNLGRLGRWDEALAEAEHVLAGRERALGPDHPDTLVARREAAVCLGWLGRWPQALTAYRGVADSRARILGPAHPDTLAAREDEARCLEQLGRPQEAEALHRQIAVLRARPASVQS
ncbi:tetratricopeptide repeat protein [Streptomyces sp. NA04227]|uniref:serine/threonine-protein kinase n=1 Tax=Streptomyces sp. NA04227 TaxID=2742136 RepID=UPI0015916E4E|nr:tetratricopeptide repeat protein [Streptomyces sp. NA04227]QKW05142.1 tetratricopeptide repeat protein [Streptomyces sp. NA04227]